MMFWDLDRRRLRYLSLKQASCNRKSTQTNVQFLAKDSPRTQGLTSSYVRPVLAAFLLDSILSLPLQSSYYQVVQKQGQDVALSDGSTVVLAKLSPFPPRDPDSPLK